MSLLVKVQPNTMFIPASMPSSASREDCQVRPCPLEIEAETVSEPFLVDGSTWQVDIFPVQGCFPGYYSRVVADRITVDGRRLHIVRVMEMHATTKPVFATDAEDALSQAEDACGDGLGEYVGTCPICTAEVALGSDTWTVTRDGKDVTDE